MGCYAGVEPTWAAQTDAGRTHIVKKGIVQSGLVLNLDAGVSSSYSGSGTTWIDLSGNGNNGTLVGSPTYNSSDLNGSITTTSGKYISTAYNFSSNTLTVSMVVKLNPSGFWACPWGNEYWNSALGYLCYFNNSTTLNFGPSSTLTKRTLNVSGYTALTYWNWVIDGTTATTYNNNVQIDSGTIGTPAGFASNGLLFGARHTNPGTSYVDVCPMTLYSVQVYNKALTASEVQQNYKAIRGRFRI